MLVRILSQSYLVTYKVPPSPGLEVCSIMLLVPKYNIFLLSHWGTCASSDHIKHLYKESTYDDGLQQFCPPAKPQHMHFPSRRETIGMGQIMGGCASQRPTRLLCPQLQNRNVVHRIELQARGTCDQPHCRFAKKPDSQTFCECENYICYFFVRVHLISTFHSTP